MERNIQEHIEDSLRKNALCEVPFDTAENQIQELNGFQRLLLSAVTSKSARVAQVATGLLLIVGSSMRSSESTAYATEATPTVVRESTPTVTFHTQTPAPSETPVPTQTSIPTREATPTTVAHTPSPAPTETTTPPPTGTPTREATPTTVAHTPTTSPTPETTPTVVHTSTPKPGETPPATPTKTRTPTPTATSTPPITVGELPKLGNGGPLGKDLTRGAGILGGLFLIAGGLFLEKFARRKSTSIS